MNRFESIENLERLRMALTVVIGNDIIIPSVEQREAVFAYGFVYGYIWRYKNCGVKVDLSSVVRAEILEHNELDSYIEATRSYVKGELYRLMGREVKNNAM
ncbi:hypothetical protein PK1910_01040 [Veillonella parvula]|uniref:hypothetical protein n=1 Tax=Veillonella parvula TaxID=29466 RepID=UPI002F350B53